MRHLRKRAMYAINVVGIVGSEELSGNRYVIFRTPFFTPVFFFRIAFFSGSSWPNI